jgi:signal transduction histidine kinase
LGGLHRLNPSNGKFSTYLKGKTIINIFEDNKGTLWVSEPDGLFRFNSAADSFYRVPDPVSGRYVNNLRSALIDDKGNFWFGTSDGIMKTDVHQNVTTLYGKNFGVAGNDLAFGFSYKGPTGKLYFGSSNGYYAFYPEQVTKGIKPPEILLSAFYLGNKMAQPGKDGPLKNPIWEAKKIELPYNQNVFSFEFAAIDFVNPADNRHLFMLDDYDNEWRQGGAEHKAYYFNVPPGHYTFRVKAANSDGLWAEKSLVVVITPPWWRTWWAYFLYGLLFVVGAYLIYRHQKRRLVAAERERARTRELAQAKEIERAYQELKVTQAQLVQREKMASLGELTAGIAHEIQNPLNFVNNFSETNKELVAELQQEIKNKNYEEAAAIAADINANEEKISHHGKRADNIVKGMLQHARASSGEKQPTDINQLTEEYLRLAYQGLRAKDKTFTVHLQTSFDETIGQVTAVSQEIGRVLLNLYNNAFYAVQGKKAKLNGTFEPIVSVSTKKEGNSVVIVVKDNGTGMSEQVVNKVFQPFFTTKPTGEGTGLGLSLSYDIVTKGHNGTINVESKEGEGSLFVITLPTT